MRSNWSYEDVERDWLNVPSFTDFLGHWRRTEKGLQKIDHVDKNCQLTRIFKERIELKARKRLVTGTQDLSR